jgi:aspartyl-tRNA(Asn)/glutamyl-tRNA(Gln) amidotransferase subunit C
MSTVMDKKTVQKVARLSSIEMSDEQLDNMAPQLSKILGFIEQLSEVDTEGVEPLANVVDIDLRLREDVINDGDCVEKVLANAPEATQGFFVVPKVVEQES